MMRIFAIFATVPRKLSKPHKPVCFNVDTDLVLDWGDIAFGTIVNGGRCRFGVRNKG